MRGEYLVGMSGVVAEIDSSEERSLGVRHESGGCSGFNSRDEPVPIEPGDVVFDYPDSWEPILDQHQPCDADFKRDLDRMLDKEEVR